MLLRERFALGLPVIMPLGSSIITFPDGTAAALLPSGRLVSPAEAVVISFDEQKACVRESECWGRVCARA